jgi:WD40 repeat protein
VRCWTSFPFIPPDTFSFRSREQRWIASGSFDRTIKLWDLNGSSKSEPLANLVLPDATASTKSSIYALATDPFGHTIASGSPERVVRLWDPRSGKRAGKLVGHTDNIRAILISDDARYVSHLALNLILLSSSDVALAFNRFCRR